MVNRVMNSQELKIPNEQHRKKLRKKLKLKPSTGYIKSTMSGLMLLYRCYIIAAEDKVIELEKMLEEERIRCQGEERKATEVDQRRQDAEQRVHELEEAIQKAEGAVHTLTQEKAGEAYISTYTQNQMSIIIVLQYHF